MTPIVCLNVRAGGGVRVGALIDWLDTHRAAIVVLSEWRANVAGERFTEWARLRGLHHAGLADGGTANGVFVAATEPFKVETATPSVGGPGCLMLAGFAGLNLLACYFPQFNAKVPFFARCGQVAAAHAGAPFLLAGDLNTGNQAADRSERADRYSCAEGFDGLSARHGLHDLWRRSNGADAREWTWLSHRGNGFRIDHAFANTAFIAQANPACRYDHAPRENALSDHSGLIVTATRKWRSEK